MAATNGVCDQLIGTGHTDAATIAEWKDQINESWSNLLELIETRTKVNKICFVIGLGNNLTPFSANEKKSNRGLSPHVFPRFSPA